LQGSTGGKSVGVCIVQGPNATGSGKPTALAEILGEAFGKAFQRVVIGQNLRSAPGIGGSVSERVVADIGGGLSGTRGSLGRPMRNLLRWRTP